MIGPRTGPTKWSSVLKNERNPGGLDLLTGITAFKRRTGEYLVFVEENYKAKLLIYRWVP